MQSLQEHDVQVFSPSNQSLLPLQTSSRDISSPEWMLGGLTGGQTPHSDGANHFRPSSSLNNLSGGGQLEGHQMLALIETSNMRPGEGGHPGDSGSNQNIQAGRTQMDFLQQHNTGTESGGDNNNSHGGGSVDGPDLKYSDLQALRPYGPPSIYDSHHNLL